MAIRRDRICKKKRRVQAIDKSVLALPVPRRNVLPTRTYRGSSERTALAELCEPCHDFWYALGRLPYSP
jgi:hypothetical protein